MNSSLQAAFTTFLQPHLNTFMLNAVPKNSCFT